MLRRLLALMLLMFSSAALTALADDSFSVTAQIHETLPVMTISVADTGVYHPDELREYVLSVTIEAADGSFMQKMTYQSSEEPAFAQAVGMVKVQDVNFDGYNDLLLLAGAGARNVYHAVALWDAQEGCFRPVIQTNVWDRETALFAHAFTQAELCNIELYPEQRMLVSDEADGYAYHRVTWYMWDGSYALSPKYVWDVYNAGPGLIGESMTGFATRVTFYWDEVYPEDWYYGEDGVYGERRASARCIAMGSPFVDSTRTMRVANVDWVNLRKQNSKASPSLAKIDAGHTVTALEDPSADADGWIRVLYEDPFVTMDEYDTGRYSKTGYIWHSYLEPAP